MISGQSKFKRKLMPRALITGGGGFIGFNMAKKLLSQNWQIIILDNLSRTGSDKNVRILQQAYPNTCELINADIRNEQEVRKAVEGVDFIYHFAGQVAVTTSVDNPREDFEVNSMGTLNILEAAKIQSNKPGILYSSTNKVYGGMENIQVEEKDNRYTYSNQKSGISESMNLDFHSPYGCSKGSADQYVRDYSRIYGLQTLVFRNSCIYGPPQMGNEDQGWLAHFIISACLNKPITIYGDGKQVRDVLFIDDLINVYTAATDKINTVSGQIFNMGGGPKNTVSLLELIAIIEEKLNYEVNIKFENWRPGDQRVYISNIDLIKSKLNWEPKVSVSEGTNKLTEWVLDNISNFDNL